MTTISVCPSLPTVPTTTYFSLPNRIHRVLLHSPAHTVTVTTGMSPESYFLSFARLARRSALFWGHAVTSGISAFDAVALASDGVRARHVGGVDYFVSSWLFEDRVLGRLAQRNYSERWVGRYVDRFGGRHERWGRKRARAGQVISPSDVQVALVPLLLLFSAYVFPSL